MGLAAVAFARAPGGAPDVPYAIAPGIGNLGAGAWDWFSDPRAVTVGSTTYVGWVGWRGQITIAALEAGSIAAPTHVVGFTYPDDHCSPAIVVEPDGRLTLFWSEHNGKHLYYRTSTEPGEISTWGPLEEIGSNVPGRLGYTYPNPVLLSAEQDKLYLFFRGGDWSSDYTTRSAAGTWTRARRLIAVPGERPYVKVDSDGAATIAFAFTNGHPRSVQTSIYFAEYRQGSLWTAGGRRIAPLSRAPISPKGSELVYDAGRTGARSWVWDVALDGGHPVVVYATFPSSGNHRYWYARWSGRRWVDHFLTYAGGSISPGTIETDYSGGLALDHADPSTVFISRRKGSGWQIERWHTSNGGSRWQHSVVVDSEGTQNVRPVVPRGSVPGSTDLLWLSGEYGSYHTYRTYVEYLR